MAEKIILTDLKVVSKVTAGQFVKTGGTASQFLKADGTVDSNAYIYQSDRGLTIESGKVGHSNSVTAKTTQALYPIKFDAYGHITGSGTAVTSLPANGGNADTVDLLHLNDQAMAYTDELSITIGVGSGCLAGTITEAEIFALTGNIYGKYYLASDTNKVYRRKTPDAAATPNNWRDDTAAYNASLLLANQLQDEPYIYVKINTGYTYYSKLPKFFITASYDNVAGSTTITGYCRSQNKFMINSCDYNANNLLGIYQPSGNTNIYYLKLKRYASNYGAVNDYSVTPKVMINYKQGTPNLEFIGKNHAEYAAVNGYDYISVPRGGLTHNNIQVINGSTVPINPKFTDTWNANTKTVAGYVSAPGAVANKVWKTDASGNPGWRDDADTTYSVATQSTNGLMSSSDKTKLDGIATGATKVLESTVSGWGFTKNTGTVTSVAVKMNGSTVGTVTTTGTIDLGTVITAHQSLDGCVKTTGAQSVGGVKTFTSAPVFSEGATISAGKSLVVGAETTYEENQIHFNNNGTPYNLYLKASDGSLYYLKNTTTVIAGREVATVGDLSSKEDIINKSNNFETDKASTVKYYNAKTTYDAVQDVREVAEGKTTSFVVSNVTNPIFNSQNDVITLTGPFTDIKGNVVQLTKLRLGDNFYVTQTDSPDRWVSGFLDKALIGYTEGNTTSGTYISPAQPATILSDVYYTDDDQEVELRGIGEYKDVYDGNGHITRKIGIYTFTGNEVWDNGASATLSGYRCLRNTSLFSSSIIAIKSGVMCQFYCDRFIPQNSSTYNVENRITRWNGTTNQGMICISEEELGITSSASQSEAVTAFQNWLRSHPTKVYYPLNVETTENVILYAKGELAGVNLNKLETAKVPVTDVRFNNVTVVSNNIATIPYNLSSYNNDAGFLTQHQSLANYVTLDGVQTILGKKTFSNDINILNDKTISFNTGQTVYSYNGITTNSTSFVLRSGGNLDLISEIDNIRINSGIGKAYYYVGSIPSTMDASREIAVKADIPSFPIVNDGKLSIQGNGVTASEFTANQDGNTTLNIKGAGATTVSKTANNEITITSVNTTYESKTAVSGGTEVSLCTTGEKYTWNQAVVDGVYYEEIINGFIVTIEATGDCTYVVEEGIVYDGTDSGGTLLGTVSNLNHTATITSGHIYIDCGSGSDDRLNGATSTGGVTNAYATSSSTYNDRYASADVSGNGVLTIDTYLH